MRRPNPDCDSGLAVIPHGGQKGRMSLRPRASVLLLSGALLAGCVSRTAETPPSQVAPPQPYSTLGLEGVIGSTVRVLVAQFGSPALDLREGSARKLQFSGPACVLDAYLYPARDGAEPVVTHVDARLPDGREMDRSSCVAALSAQQQPR
jgi:hypothetical protein